MFIATVENQGQTFYLRGTTWAFHADRATRFENAVAANEATVRAARFMTKTMARKIKIIEA